MTPKPCSIQKDKTTTDLTKNFCESSAANSEVRAKLTINKKSADKFAITKSPTLTKSYGEMSRILDFPPSVQ